MAFIQVRGGDKTWGERRWRRNGLAFVGGEGWGERDKRLKGEEKVGRGAQAEGAKEKMEGEAIGIS